MTFLWQLFDQSRWLTVLNGLGGTARAVSGPRVWEWGGCEFCRLACLGKELAWGEGAELWVGKDRGLQVWRWVARLAGG